jgi:hypothetical protein
MTETVTRHRGGGRDEDGQLIAATDAALTAIAVAPGAGSEFAERAREGESTAYTVYFPTGTDVVNSDEMTVRGERFGLIVNDWRSPWTGRGGLEVLCTRSQG